MIIRCIKVFVKEEYINDFKAASVRNHNKSLEEPGILRFDVLQSEESPAEFLLYEVYVSIDATKSHKETDHYKEWKQTVEPMMAKPRESTAYTAISPTTIEKW